MNILDPREESSLKLYRWKKKICLFCLLFSVRDRRKYGWMIGITPLSLSLYLVILYRVIIIHESIFPLYNRERQNGSLYLSFFSLFAVFNLKKKKESYEIETRHGRIIGWKMLFLIINVVIISRDNSYRGKKKCISRIYSEKLSCITSPV